jgi:ATP-dependent Clp protease protease subunit
MTKEETINYPGESPELIEAKIQYYSSQAKLFNKQAEKEDYISKQHEFAADEARRLHETIEHSNEQNRVYDFLGVIDERSVEACIQNLSRWKRQSTQRITVRISSPGGQVISGLALYDFFEGLKVAGIELRIVVLGMAASMASVLLQAGSVGQRVLGPNARYMVHEISGGAIGKLSDLEDETKLYKSLNDQLYDLLAKRSKLSRKEIEVKAKRRDFWMTANEAVANGFADHIGSE